MRPGPTGRPCLDGPREAGLQRAPPRGTMWRMQLRLPWLDRVLAPRAAREPRAVEVDGRTFPIDVARHRLARRYLLRVRPDGRLRLTVPRGASIEAGVRFAASQSAWIAREWRRLEGRSAPWTADSLIWFRGEQVRGSYLFSTVLADPVPGLEPGPAPGPGGLAPDPAKLWKTGTTPFKVHATRELVPRCLALARQCGVDVARVSVRDQRSRWGACSARGVITLNWRLIQMPPDVSDYVIFHELMHRRQPNHSIRFWREVESVCPGWRDAERWLRKHGRDLMP